MKIGLYFGSFNPIHHGHLILAQHFLQETDLQELWFIVSPQNPLKASGSLLNEQHRFRLVEMAIENAIGLRASKVEFKLPRPSYTADTLTYLSEQYPRHQFVVLMGSDSYQNISKWKNYQHILNNYPLYIYLRPGFPVDNPTNHAIKIMDAPLLQISSTHIRELIAEGKSIRYLVPETVEEEIKKEHYYQSSVENPAKKKTT